MSGPLGGVKVLDLTVMLAGPFSTLMLADLGADIVKIESPEGDLTRSSGPFLPDDRERAFGGYFASVNRNKRSIVVDLKSPGGVDVLLRMVRDADILVENYRAGVMDRLGLSWERLHEVNPRLVYATMRGFGDPRHGESPYVDRPAFDIVIQAMAGLMGITGPSADEPMKTGPGLGDIIPGLFLTSGVLAALRQAERTGQGQHVDVAMFDAVLAVCERIVYQYTFGGVSPRAQGNSHPLLVPFDVFPTSDGQVTIAAPADGQWRHLAEIIGRPDLGSDARTATNGARVENATLVRQVVGAWTSSRTKGEVEELLAGKVPVGAVNYAADIVDSPHVKAREMVVHVEHPGSAVPARLVASPIKLSGGAPEPRRAPTLSEHALDVLTQYGFEGNEIQGLIDRGVVHAPGFDA